jgi:CRISPR-associated protein Cas5t
MPVLRLNIYQPQAHYRVPFTYQRRHTYPIPPYSTIIGFLCNVCGIDDQENEIYKDIISKLKISISGKFKLKNTEMVWFRNLAKESHIKTYGSLDIREKNGNVGHIGGQSPMKIDILEDVELFIYLYNEKIENLEILKKNLINPKDRLQVLHIGRAEDWIVYKSELKILDDDNLIYKRRDADYGLFFWIPEKIYKVNNSQINFEEFSGNFYILPTFSKIENYDKHHNHTGKRIYNKSLKAKLSDGKFFGVELLFDKELNIPIFLGDLE